MAFSCLSDFEPHFGGLEPGLDRPYNPIKYILAYFNYTFAKYRYAIRKYYSKASCCSPVARVRQQDQRAPGAFQVGTSATDYARRPE